MRAQDFSKFSFSALYDLMQHEGSLLCIGLWLDDAELWCRECSLFTTESEKAHARRFVHVMDAARHLAGRALVRRVLGLAARPLGEIADFACNPWGKPFCPELELSGIDFSISHSGAMVWAAFCRGAFVGIDVEEALPLMDVPGLAGQLHPEEQAAILALPPEEQAPAFYRCWTRKEALIKATGMGLSQPLNTFQVNTTTKPHSWIIAPPKEYTPEWTSTDIPINANYHCSVAATTPNLKPTVHTL